ncbi:MAG: hypothetical protein ACE14Q_09360, partial [Acidobacteriota bacterium]
MRFQLKETPSVSPPEMGRLGADPHLPCILPIGVGTRLALPSNLYQLCYRKKSYSLTGRFRCCPLN